jgi:hypothetical protein
MVRLKEAVGMGRRVNIRTGQQEQDQRQESRRHGPAQNQPGVWQQQRSGNQEQQTQAAPGQSPWPDK